MTSKSPVRSADDIDEATLSYAEIKAIATGNPLIKEKMDIDVKLERLKMAKSEFLHAHEQLEHKIKHTYPKRILETQALLDKINHDLDTLKKNTVLDENGQEKFSIILNGKTFNDKKEASAFIADLLKKNSSSHCPLGGLSGEYKGLKIFTAYEQPHLHEQLVLRGETTLRKNTSSVAGDNINRIIDMANFFTKYAADTQAEIENLRTKINEGQSELATPFPQQEEFDKLLLRSAELTNLLNEDANSSENERANLQAEQQHRIQYILNGEPETSCEKYFFVFAKKQLSGDDNEWTASLDKKAVTSLLDEGFSKDNVSRTILKCSPSVPSKENIQSMIEEYTSRAASSR